jgi:hypothetical protein
MPDVQGFPVYQKNFFDAAVGEAFQENGFPNHSCGSEYDGFHKMVAVYSVADLKLRKEWPSAAVPVKSASNLCALVL